MTWKPKPPRVDDLTRAQYSGWNCCWCNVRLWHGARSAGRATGYSGVHDLSVEVYECGARCPKRPTSSRTGDDQ